MRKSFVAIVLIGAFVAYLANSISNNLKTQRNDVSISIHDTHVASTSLSIAVIGDVHLPKGPEPLANFHKLLLEVKAYKPDLVVFVGDYIRDPYGEGLEDHREKIINLLKVIDPIPRAVVLGNYETWSNAANWLTEFNRLGVHAMENEVKIFETSKGDVCVRGLGDRYTNRFSYIDYPDKCLSLPKVTITHDPAGAVHSRVRGLVIAGHTHCGQISLPLIGPLWVPTEAPASVQCGLYQDDYRTVFVTSGVGTAILPLRYGAQSQWDLITWKLK